MFVRFRFLQVCIAQPGQTGHKLQLLPACPIDELRRKVTEKYNVEPECQLLVNKGQVLLNEHPESKSTMKIGDYIVQGDYTGAYFIKEETIHFFVNLDNTMLSSG